MRCAKTPEVCQYRRVTPGGAMAVRGTAFDSEVDADGNTTIRTFEGKVAFMPDRKGSPEIEITAGRQATVAWDGRVLDQRAVETAKAAGWSF